MTLNSSVIGAEEPGQTLLLTRSRLRAFAKATGQVDPIYLDVDAARSAGHRDLPAPPTFLFGIDLEAPNPFAFIEGLGIDLRTVLHGEQQFTYHEMACAGDELSTHTKVVDVYSKKGGALDFLVRETTVTNQDGAVVAELRNTLVIQNRPTGADVS
ncbi:MaoC family dehydratase N-terminal domain-containing protein [Dietzia sp. KRD202]|uniref:MaoC family dehydratase N-terminal domain-containing protein n=1 Tax=Dietzia sp. KRD202 TaxID=2729732 RepID=UPI0019D17741|nr:MaoC family dehydratase N-terminal domain-containing protein [Dietzia sp. KRD202]